MHFKKAPEPILMTLDEIVEKYKKAILNDALESELD